MLFFNVMKVQLVEIQFNNHHNVTEECPKSARKHKPAKLRFFMRMDRCGSWVILDFNQRMLEKLSNSSSKLQNGQHFMSALSN